MTSLTTTIPTPDGPFTIIERDGVVLASGWTADTADLTGQIHVSLKPVSMSAAPAELRRITDAVDAYYDGDLAAILEVPVHQLSGPFRTRAWEVLREVPAGKPVTYAQYAALTGRATAVRAAAAACARNAAALFVPCHRVVRTDGTLGGFRWGLEVKRRLLDREAAARGLAPAVSPAASGAQTALFY
jgi:methylated-DNA-[protein]-cysteine S-methyltransferase